MIRREFLFAGLGSAAVALVLTRARVAQLTSKSPELDKLTQDQQTNLANCLDQFLGNDRLLSQLAPGCSVPCAVRPSELDPLIRNLLDLEAPARVAYLTQAAQRDFENGAIEVSDGWVLSRTERHALALKAALNPSS